ncbi:MAG: radical SAM protein [Candidatus Methanoperedens sp.]|nr:radical SAM protein [Candidatus Methanoperedens sp.]
MVKVLFVYANSDIQYWLPIGLASLSAYLKKHGHHVELYDSTKKSFSIIELELNAKISDLNPDLIAISSVSAGIDLAYAMAEFIKKQYDIKILFGGVHTTNAPEEVISKSFVDMVCIGEGDFALLELVTKMENKEDYFDTQNFWFKKDDAIIKNQVRPLIENLDSLPFPDRSIFDDKFTLWNDGRINSIHFMAGRGCPFDCFYCNNSNLTKMYKGKGKYVRMHSVDYVIEEIKSVLKTYGSKSDSPIKISFVDDTFTLYKKWLTEFCVRYSSEIGLPFACLTRADTVNEEILLLLKKSGCVDVSMAIETGNIHLRNKMLNRYQTDEQIINAYKTAKKIGLKTVSYNLIGIPFETKETIKETIEINKKANPDIVSASILQPYEGLPIYKICKENGFLIENTALTSSQQNKNIHLCPSNLKLPGLSNYDLKKAHDMLSLYVKYPRFLYILFDGVYYIFYYTGQRDNLKKFLDIVALYKYVGLKRFIFLVFRKIGIVHRGKC